MVDPSHRFHVADYAVFSVAVVVSLAIGVYFALSGGRQRTTSEYLVGGRSMRFFPVAISLIVSFESSIMMLGWPAELYVYGVQFWLTPIAWMTSNIISIFTVIPMLHSLKITSAYEYLQYRFNSTSVRLLGTFMGMLHYIWYMGIVLFGPAIALEAVTGFSQWSSMLLVATAAVIYTSIGGIKAVIWTDVFQSLIMYTGIFSILIKGTLDVGGAKKVWEIAGNGERLNLFNFDLDPTVRHTFWSLTIGSFFRSVSMIFNQSTIQRVSSTSSAKDAQKMMMLAAPLHFVFLSLAAFEGIVAYAYYDTVGCDPLASKKISNPNQIIPFTVMDIFKSVPGMPGLFLASLFCASLSTLSSGLSSLSAMCWVDFIKPRLGEVSELKATVIAKISVVVFGFIGVGLAMLVSLIGGTLSQIAISLLSAFSSPLTSLFLMGCFCPWVNAKGAFVGSFVSLLLTVWLSLAMNFNKTVKRTPFLPPASMDNCLANHSTFLLNASTVGVTSYYGQPGLANGSYYDYDVKSGFLLETSEHYVTLAATAMDMTTQASPDPVPQGIEVLYTMSYQWLGPIGIIVGMIIGSLASLATGGNKEEEVHPRYLISFCDHLCCYLPESLKKVFRCSGDYASVKAEDAALRDLFLDTEISVDKRPDGEDTSILATHAQPAAPEETSERPQQPLTIAAKNGAVQGGSAETGGQFTSVGRGHEDTMER